MTAHEEMETVLAAKPRLKETLARYGRLFLREYFSRAYFPPAVSAERQAELLDAVESYAERLLGADVAKSVRAQLSENYYVSTADHHGPLCHPFFSNSAIAHAGANRERGHRNVLVFSCSGISLDNSSFPRGLFFHGERLEEIRMPFFSLKHRHQPVHAMPPYSAEAVSRAFRQAPSGLAETLRPMYADPAALSLATYGEQVTRTNWRLWKRVPGQQDIDLVYLEQETLARDLLLRHHLDADTPISRILFDAPTRSAFARHFDGIDGAFSSREKKGTFLFWHIKDGRKQLRLEGEALAASGGASVPLTQEGVREGLRDGTLMPGMALTFSLLSFYYGLTCGGGFCQVNYLTEMKAAYSRVTGDGVPAATDFFCGEFVLAQLCRDGKAVPATPLDLMLRGDAAYLEKQLDTLTLGEAVGLMMPEFFRIVTGRQSSCGEPAKQIPCIHVT